MTTPPSDVSESAQSRMRAVYDEHLHVAEQLLERETWDIDDIDCSPKEFLRVVQRLSGEDVIVEHHRRMRDSQRGEGQDRIVVWEWREACRAWLREYVAHRNELPCRHRAHIYTTPDGDLDCRFCDERREFTREQVKEAMS